MNRNQLNETLLFFCCFVWLLLLASFVAYCFSEFHQRLLFFVDIFVSTKIRPPKYDNNSTKYSFYNLNRFVVMVI